MGDLSWYAITIGLVEWGIRLCLIGVVIARRRNVSTKLAWIIILTVLPIVGTILYVMIGENRLGYRRLRRYALLTQGMDQQAIRLWKHRHQNWSGQDAMYEHIWKLATTEAGLPPLAGNRVELLARNDRLLERLTADIDAARSHCHLLFYIYTTSPACWKVSEALMRAARRGVTCRLLVDAVGSKQFLRGDEITKMRHAGVQVVAALPVNPIRLLLSRLDLRNHRKIVVIDGRVGYTGSANLTDSSFRAGWNRRVGSWIDAMARVEGPAAQALSVVFLQDWQAEIDNDSRDVTPYLPELPADEVGSSVLQVMPSGPGASPDAIHQLMLTAIYGAREELIITTPYFVPDEALCRALCAAAQRGVAVTLVMPREVDSPLVAAASRSSWIDLLGAGVRICLFRGGLLHAKTFTIDRRIGFIGSANLDQRSFWLNFEITLIIYDDEVASELRFLQVDYIDHADHVHLDEWRSRPRVNQFLDSAAQMLGPLL
ncbi:MAG: cardiolipin synthase [Phycisphaerales bacterium]